MERACDRTGGPKSCRLAGENDVSDWKLGTWVEFCTQYLESNGDLLIAVAGLRSFRSTDSS